MMKRRLPGIVAAMDIVDKNDKFFDFKKALCSLGIDSSVSNKLDVLAWISDNLKNIDDDDYEYITNWNSAAYKVICESLRNGIGSNNGTLEIVNVLRWGNALIKKDVETARSILDEYYPFSQVIQAPANYSPNVLYAHVNMLNYYWSVCSDNIEKKCLATQALPLLKHLLLNDTWLRNRANYNLSIVSLIHRDFIKAMDYFIDAITDKYSILHQRHLILKIILDDFSLPAALVSKIILDDCILNSLFWEDFAERVSCNVISRRAIIYSSRLSARNLIGKGFVRLSDNDFEVLNSLFLVRDANESLWSEKDRATVYLLACDENNPVSIRIMAFKKLAFYSLLFSKNIPFSLYYFSMALYLRNDDELKVKIQNIFIDADEYIMLLALQEEFSCNASQAYNILSRARNSPVWITGDVCLETRFIEILIRLSGNKKDTIINVIAKVRASYLYVIGESIFNHGLKIQNFKRADNYLDEVDFSGVEVISSYIRKFGFYKYQKELISDSGDHIYMECEGSNKLLIVFSCKYYYNVFSSVPSFLKNKKTNVLFLNNPLSNWYSDAEEKRIDSLIKELALNKFDRSNVYCYSGSMGGYAAIKFAYKHNLKSLAVNPQFNLNLWALARPADADTIFSIKSQVNLDKMSKRNNKFLRTCIIVGQNPIDSLAFQAWLDHVIDFNNFTILLIKHDIVEHAGLIYKAYGDQYIDVIYSKLALLEEIDGGEDGLREIYIHDIRGIQSEIANAKNGEWIIKAIDGRFWCI